MDRLNVVRPIRLRDLPALLALAKVLPESWFNRLFYHLLVVTRARRVGRGKYRPAS